MRCLNEDEKEQYKGDKNIITAVLVSDTKPEEFPSNGKHISNLTENDILAPGSRMMILDGSDDIYVMKESNFNPNEGDLAGYYELKVVKGSNGTYQFTQYDKSGNVIDQSPALMPPVAGIPMTFHDLYLRTWYDGGSPYFPDSNTFAVYVADGSPNRIVYNEHSYNVGEQVYIQPYGGPDGYANWTESYKIFRFDIIAGYKGDWLKIGG